MPLDKDLQLAFLRWHVGASSCSAQDGGLAIDIDTQTLARIAEHFRHRWDPLVLAELSEQPSRFRALASRLETHVGEHVDDNALSRSLHRLTRFGLVTAERRSVGRRDLKTYRLTRTGREQVGTFAAFVAVITHKPEDGHNDGCCIHGPHQTGEVA